MEHNCEKFSSRYTSKFQIESSSLNQIHLLRRSEITVNRNGCVMVVLYNFASFLISNDLISPYLNKYLKKFNQNVNLVIRWILKRFLVIKS